jgi:hypothetical protein
VTIFKNIKLIQELLVKLVVKLSRAYIPESLWPQIKEKFIALLKKVKVGKPNEPTSFLSSVIDKAVYFGYIERAKNSTKKLKLLLKMNSLVKVFQLQTGWALLGLLNFKLLLLILYFIYFIKFIKFIKIIK